jgi:hypothetical protein
MPAPVEVLPIPVDYVPYIVIAGLAFLSACLGLFSFYLYLSYSDFELTAIDLLSRQSQQISEHEVRLIRMIAEREDLEDIIRGLEAITGVS